LNVTEFFFVGDRSHVIEKQHNLRTQEREEHQEFVNLDESQCNGVSVNKYLGMIFAVHLQLMLGALTVSGQRKQPH
jgi:hypothetical protein